MRYRKIWFATSNKHKFAEAESVLKAAGLKIEHADVAVPEIRADSCEQIAEQSAREAFRMLRKPVFVEDAGLFVHALNGFPGTYSAWAFKKLGNTGLLKLLTGVKNRRACFASAVAFCDGRGVKVFRGLCWGSISPSQTGSNGFGYDPVFVPSGTRASFAQDPEKKMLVSHRVKALKAFAKWVAESKRL